MWACSTRRGISIQDQGQPTSIHFTLQQLADHFEISEVPDVATINPEGYKLNLALLQEIEQLVAQAGAMHKKSGRSGNRHTN